MFTIRIFFNHLQASKQPKYQEINNTFAKQLDKYVKNLNKNMN